MIMKCVDQPIARQFEVGRLTSSLSVGVSTLDLMNVVKTK